MTCRDTSLDTVRVDRFRGEQQELVFFESCTGNICQ